MAAHLSEVFVLDSLSRLVSGWDLKDDCTVSVPSYLTLEFEYTNTQ